MDNLCTHKFIQYKASLVVLKFWDVHADLHCISFFIIQCSTNNEKVSLHNELYTIHHHHTLQFLDSWKCWLELHYVHFKQILHLITDLYVPVCVNLLQFFFFFRVRMKNMLSKILTVSLLSHKRNEDFFPMSKYSP